MIAKVLDLLRNYKKRRNIKAVMPFVRLNRDSYYGNSFRIDIRDPAPNKIYMKTGQHCVLEGNYVFEKQSGEISIGDRVQIRKPEKSEVVR